MTSLVTWLWQGLLVTGVAGMLVHSLPRLNAATRHVVWWIAAVLVVLHPWTQSSALVDALPGSASAPTVADALPGGWLVLPPPPSWLVVGALAVWLCVVAIRSWQVVRGLGALARLKRESHAFPSARERRLRLWRAARLSGRQSERRPGRLSRRHCELRVSKEQTGACALGFWRPVILLPECLLQALSDEELDQVVMHEHAHLLRYDDWLRLIQCAVGVVLGLHPALWLIGRRIDFEREAACDDDVVNRTGAPHSYAACLAHVATVVLTRQQQQPLVAPSATGSAAMLRARVRRLLDPRPTRTSRPGWMPAIASSAILLAVVAGSGQVPPLVVFFESRVSAASGAAPFAVPASRNLPLTPSVTAGDVASVDEALQRAAPTAAQGVKRATPLLTVGGEARERQAAPAAEVMPADVAQDPPAVDVGPPVLISTRTMSDLIAQAPTAPGELVSVSSAGSSAGTARVSDPFLAIGSSATQSGIAIAARAQRFGQRVTDAARAVARKPTL